MKLTKLRRNRRYQRDLCAGNFRIGLPEVLKESCPARVNTRWAGQTLFEQAQKRNFIVIVVRSPLRCQPNTRDIERPRMRKTRNKLSLHVYH